MITINPKEITTPALQMILQTAISPRPIALASTIDKEGNINLSPFSFFNMFSTNPPILIFSPSSRVRDNTTKHTLQNVKEVKEVVIGTVNYDMVQQVSLSSTEYDKETNEFIKAGLTMKDAHLIKPKLIAESPVNFECEVKDIINLGTEGGAGNLVICEIKKIHIRPEFTDENGNLSQEKLNMVARLGGNYYGLSNAESLFEVPKPLVTLGIGFDQLPQEILHSKVLTGNDLGMLANVETLPKGNYTSDESLHLKAQQLLKESKVNEAWNILKI